VRMPVRVMCVVLAGLAAAGVMAQEAKKQEAAQPAMPMLKPGPEHEILKMDVGVWDATVEMIIQGASPSTSKAVETNKMLAGLWLVSDFKGEMMNQPFEGHGVTGYDPNKKKYVGTWVDSMSTGLNIGESTYDAATRTVTGTMEGPDDTGKMMSMRFVTQYKGDNAKTFTMYMKGPDGKEVPTVKINYRRRK